MLHVELASNEDISEDPDQEGMELPFPSVERMLRCAAPPALRECVRLTQWPASIHDMLSLRRALGVIDEEGTLLD